MLRTLIILFIIYVAVRTVLIILEEEADLRKDGKRIREQKAHCPELEDHEKP